MTRDLSNTGVNVPPLGHRKRKWHLHKLKKKHISKNFKNCLIWIQFRLKKPRKLKCKVLQQVIQLVEAPKMVRILFAGIFRQHLKLPFQLNPNKIKYQKDKQELLMQDQCGS